MKALRALVVVAVLGNCTCEREENVLLESDDGAAKLLSVYTESAGCAAAGGHGVPIVVPKMDKNTGVELAVGAARKGKYPVGRCGCGNPTNLEISDDHFFAQWRCPDSGRWSLVVTLPEIDGVACDFGDAAADLDSLRLSERFEAFRATAPEGMEGALYEALLEREGADALTATLIASLAQAGHEFDDAARRLDDPHRARVFAAIRAAVADASDPVVLGKVRLLPVEDRALVIATALRLADGPLAGRAQLREVVGVLASTGVDDLTELAVALDAKNRCNDFCEVIFAGTDMELPRIEGQLFREACGGAACEGGLCDEKETGSLTELVDALAQDGTHQSRARYRVKLAHIAARHRPELKSKLQQRLARRDYAKVMAPECTDPRGRSLCDCKSVATHACVEDEMTFTRGCLVEIDDNAKTLTVHPRPSNQKSSAAADAGLAD